jgi:sortase B
MKNKKKGGKKCRLLIRKTIKVILIAALSISCWEIGKKQLSYRENISTYNKIEQEKNNAENMQEFLAKYNFDWITVTGTAIDYPLVQGEDNNYYITHDYQGNDDIGGAIFYDAYDRPYNETLTAIYGHSMRNGAMFNNLHYFQKDHERFKNSKLTISTKEKTTTYKPLAYYVTNDDYFYKDLDLKTTDEAIKEIKMNSDYFIRNTSIKEDSHIIALYTCDYSIENGRLIVFYISE